jgi:hypothetical protein
MRLGLTLLGVSHLVAGLAVRFGRSGALERGGQADPHEDSSHGVEETLMTGADFTDASLHESGGIFNDTVPSSDAVLVPFVEVMDQCLYAPRETLECVDFDRHGPSLSHAIIRRYVFMVVVLAIALWSLGNSVCLEAMGRIMNIEKDEENREVLNAVVSEITVHGFIALVSGVASRTNFLNKISPAVFGEPPVGGAHSGELFLVRLVSRLFLAEDPSPEDLEPMHAAAIERFPDIPMGAIWASLPSFLRIFILVSSSL